MTHTVDNGSIEVLLAKEAIWEVLTNYCRSVDRLDRELMLSVWHPGATVEYEGRNLKGTAEELVDVFMVSHLSFASHSHQVTNATIVVDGDTAVSESYVTARLRSFPDPAGRCVDIVVAARYLDRWSTRDGRWAIDHRHQITDVFSQYEVIATSANDVPDGDNALAPLSRRDRSDPSYALLESLGSAVG